MLHEQNPTCLDHALSLAGVSRNLTSNPALVSWECRNGKDNGNYYNETRDYIEVMRVYEIL